MDGYVFGWYFSIWQFFTYAAIAALKLKYATGKFFSTRKASIISYILLAFIQVASMGLANASLVYLSYPVQV
jgi:hypothetical protein